jgi:hypothetical protein
LYAKPFRTARKNGDFTFTGATDRCFVCGFVDFIPCKHIGDCGTGLTENIMIRVPMMHLTSRTTKYLVHFSTSPTSVQNVPGFLFSTQIHLRNTKHLLSPWRRLQSDRLFVPSYMTCHLPFIVVYVPEQCCTLWRSVGAFHFFIGKKMARHFTVGMLQLRWEYGLDRGLRPKPSSPRTSNSLYTHTTSGAG